MKGYSWKREIETLCEDFYVPTRIEVKAIEKGMAVVRVKNKDLDNANRYKAAHKIVLGYIMSM